ncbi:hypothetical protein Naga_100049g24 [Nannochloropsis gaditana]|uniref:Uncharacterized protein n=1 Tax=Nannochloropsis gaditana TaxID=72520 RepID=W7TNG6_9STRA|nr:hypothetical protein Naga_100049g24 [Nannochloropsis gaditana]
MQAPWGNPRGGRGNARDFARAGRRQDDMRGADGDEASKGKKIEKLKRKGDHEICRPLKTSESLCPKTMTMDRLDESLHCHAILPALAGQEADLHECLQRK